MAKQVVFKLFIIYFLSVIAMPKARATCGDDAQMLMNSFSQCVQTFMLNEALYGDPNCPVVYQSPSIHYSVGQTYIWLPIVQNCPGGAGSIICDTNITLYCSSVAMPFPQTPSQAIPKPANTCGSIIHVENQIVGEEVQITGVPFSMTYFLIE